MSEEETRVSDSVVEIVRGGTGHGRHCKEPTTPAGAAAVPPAPARLVHRSTHMLDQARAVDCCVATAKSERSRLGVMTYRSRGVDHAAELPLLADGVVALQRLSAL